MTSHESWTERLDDYLDGELDAAETAAVEAHLDGCAECRRGLEELRQILLVAARLEDSPPENDLWAGIAARIDLRAVRPAGGAEASGRTVRRISFTLPQLAAAGIVLALLSGGVVRLVVPGPRAARAPVATEVPQADESAVRLASLSFGGERYGAALADLQRVLDEGRPLLDPATVVILETNLALIDRAIEEARIALAQDPASAYLNHHLADSMRRKLELLRQATSIITAQS